MSNKGMAHTLATRQKMSLSTTKDRTLLLDTIVEYIKSLQSSDFPSITRCAIYCGLSEKTLLSYEMRSPEDSEIRVLLDVIRDMAKASLMENGLKKAFDGKLTAFLLQANHGLKTEAPHLTQNNTFNVSPEILAEAIELTRSKKTALPKNSDTNNDK
jgi:hypothetical protein